MTKVLTHTSTIREIDFDALWREVLKSIRLRREEDLLRCDYACTAQVYRRNTPAFRVPRPP